MNSSVPRLVERIETLTSEPFTEVDLSLEFRALSASSFEAIWDNPEDDIYHALTGINP